MGEATEAKTQPELASNESSTQNGLETVMTDNLIIGTGPAGASLAGFLASHGRQTLNWKFAIANLL